MSDGTATGLAAVRARIAAAENAAGRPAGSVRLIAVSKTFEADAIRPGRSPPGSATFGENRVQEAKGKWPALKAEFPDARAASDRAAAIEQGSGGGGAVRRDPHDRSRQDRRRDRRRDATAGRDRCACSFRSTPARSRRRPGVAPEETDAFVARCREVHGLAIDGLMCIPPVDAVAAPHFALLAKIAQTPWV